MLPSRPGFGPEPIKTASEPGTTARRTHSEVFWLDKAAWNASYTEARLTQLFAVAEREQGIDLT